jgi:hypothetical protein
LGEDLITLAIAGLATIVARVTMAVAGLLPPLD